MILMMKFNNNSFMVNSFNCGFDSMNSEMINMSMKFYMLLMLFILFDVELLFVYSYWTWTGVEFIMLYLLNMMLMISYVYELNEGLLSWM